MAVITDLAPLSAEMDAGDLAARRTGPGLLAVSPGASPRPQEFAEDFEVQGYKFMSAGNPVPSVFVRLPRLSDRLIPSPRGVAVSPLGVLSSSPQLEVESRRARVKKLWGGMVAPTGVVSGTYAEDSGDSREFIAISFPNASEFRVECHSIVATEQGSAFSFNFAGDGGVLPAGHRENGFLAEMDGSTFSLQPMDQRGVALMHDGFGAVNRIEVQRGDADTRIMLSGRILVGTTAANARIEAISDETKFSVSILNLDDGAEIFSGSAPTERSHLNIWGGVRPEGQSGGHITVFDRASGAELRKIGIDGRLSGMAWDGASIWQALWPTGDLVLFSPKDGAELGRHAPLATGRIAGLAASGGVIVMGVCAQNILASTSPTTLQTFDPASNSITSVVPRPNVLSSGLSDGPAGLLGSVNGGDQTPVSSESYLVFVNKSTGAIEETFIFPRNFFIEDVFQESESSVLVTVTEGLSGFARTGALYQIELLGG